MVKYWDEQQSAMEVAERYHTPRDWDAEGAILKKYFELLDYQGGLYLQDALTTIPPQDWQTLAFLLQDDPAEAGKVLSKTFKTYLRSCAERP